MRRPETNGSSVASRPAADNSARSAASIAPPLAYRDSGAEKRASMRPSAATVTSFSIEWRCSALSVRASTTAAAPAEKNVSNVKRSRNVVRNLTTGKPRERLVSDVRLWLSPRMRRL
jgi:hypothetical protein